MIALMAAIYFSLLFKDPYTALSTINLRCPFYLKVPFINKTNNAFHSLFQPRNLKLQLKGSNKKKKTSLNKYRNTATIRNGLQHRQDSNCTATICYSVFAFNQIAQVQSNELNGMWNVWRAFINENAACVLSDPTLTHQSNELIEYNQQSYLFIVIAGENMCG